MNSRTTLPHLKRAASAIMMLGFIHQMGACPCGCVEHNYWLQALGVVVHEPAVDVELGPVVASSHNHDCTGATAPEFLNNAQRVESNPTCLVGWTGELASFADVQLAHVRGDASPRSPPDLISGGEIHSQLQVFLL